MSLFTNKTLLITGGTGSFGNAVLNRFLCTDIGEIRIFSRDEKKQDDMRHEFQAKMPEVADKIKFYIGDVRSLESCRGAMHGVDYIFHAAALKQVPSCEFFPMEAVRTNVIGTDNVLTAAIEAGVECVICLSTDKAAYPINAMGITKAIEEKVAVAKSRNSGKTKICCTRYGNVMCSRGSVIPLWIDQIKNGNPITITEPSMTRFIMSLEEAVDLVLFAFENGENGDLLIQKAPACTIGTQAQAVCELFGGKKEDIKVIGIRHGEKMYETLLTKATLGYIVECLHKFHDQPSTLVIPEIPNGSFEKKLYSMCLSYLPKEKVAFPLKMNVDARGSFTELLKTEKCGQVSVNISKPGITKGQHWHNSKWEFFIVVSGHGLIEERKIGTDEVLRFEVSGEKIEAVHMLPGYTHNIINLSDTDDLVTVMWANEQFDPEHPDTFGEKV